MVNFCTRQSLLGRKLFAVSVAVAIYTRAWQNVKFLTLFSIFVCRKNCICCGDEWQYRADGQPLGGWGVVVGRGGGGGGSCEEV